MASLTFALVCLCISGTPQSVDVHDTGDGGRRAPQVVQDPAEAHFVLAHGTEALGLGDSQDPLPCSLSDMESLLAQCARRVDRHVPLIVANPDFVTVDGQELRVMPGSLGRFYEGLGGQVYLMGKPDPIIYRAAQALLPAGAPCVAIGDSLEHDIAGAKCTIAGKSCTKSII